jgi:phosphoribosylamine--glycine ligase
MGAYSPAPVVTPEIHARALREVIMPTVKGMESDGLPYTGFLYAGLMISPEGKIKTLEFNCRMGDPETQPIMARLKSDFVDVLIHAENQTLDEVDLDWDSRVALGVVMAAYNYPNTPRTGDEITGIPQETEHHVVFHAGTSYKDGKLVTNGGRVLCVVGLDGNVKGAQIRAYEALQSIQFNGAQYRSDIGHLAIKTK